MENFRTLKFKTVIFLGVILFTPLFSFAYEPHTTHKALTKEIVGIFNYYYTDLYISDTDKELIMQGSIDEDDGTRALHHFYDPVHSQGLVLGGTEFLAAKYWSQDTVAQASFDPVFKQRMYGNLLDLFSSNSDFSWDRAVYEYAYGDKERGLKTLGHILHLIEDMAVPDHTRGDAHPPFGDALFHQASPYEHWADKWNVENIDIASALIEEKKTPVFCNHLNSCFDSMALYSNQNFFSKDTILKDYDLPKISNEKNELLSDGQVYTFGYSESLGDTLKLIKIKRATRWSEPEYSLIDNDNLILSDYWSHLSKQAVLHGAGVIKLFFDEVEKEKQTKVLYEKNKSWFAKQWDEMKGSAFNLAGLLYGSSVTEEDLNNTDSARLLQGTTLLASIAPTGSEATPQEPDTQNENSEPGAQNDAIAAFPVISPSPSDIVNEPALEVPIKLSATTAATTTRIIADKSTASSTSLVIPQESIQTPMPGSSAGSSNSNAPAFSFGQGASGSSGASEPAAVQPSFPPPDVTPPDIAFSVTECAASFSGSGCVTHAAELHLAWSSSASDLASYDITCSVSGSTCSGFPLSAITATSTVFIPNDNATYAFSAIARDVAGNISLAAAQIVEVQRKIIVINEIGWHGTPKSANDEYIELYNNSAYPVDLSGFMLYSETDTKPYIPLSGTIAAHGYYLIERDSDETISNVAADMVASFGSRGGRGLSNNGENLAITYASTTIDRVTSNCPPHGWCGGSTSDASMERIDTHISGDVASNWGTNNGYVRVGKDGDGVLFSNTARARNSVQRLISQGSMLSSDTFLAQTDSPYIVTTDLTVPAGMTLQAEAGTVIKVIGTHSIFVDGTLKFLGVSGNPVVVTSYADDSYGGDLNADATTTVPVAGNWFGIVFNAGASDSSILDQSLIRYGGKVYSGITVGRALVRVNGSSPMIQNSTIEYSEGYGIWMTSATSTVRDNVIRHINGAWFLTPAGIYAESGSPTIAGNTFSASNGYGLQLDPDVSAIVSSNDFSDNTIAAIASFGSTAVFSGNTASGNGVNGILLFGTISQDHSFSKDLPYVVHSNGFSAAGGTTLTIPAGTVVKFQNAGGLMTIHGLLHVQGTAENEAVFTSISDDSNGGDANNDGSATSPHAGDWAGVIVSGTGTSTVSYAKFLYGGKFYTGIPRAALQVSSGAVDITHSVFDLNDYQGLRLMSANGSSVAHTQFSNHSGQPGSAGIYLETSNVILDTLTVRDNTTGILSNSSMVTSVGTHVFSGNMTTTSPADLLGP